MCERGERMYNMVMLNNAGENDGDDSHDDEKDGCGGGICRG